jgi:flagellin
MSMMAQRNLGVTYGKMSESINALSSGLRINSADDDAAGLAIRETMRAQVKALDQGIRNANDAISMLQTFDGAAQVIDEKLVRMKELAEQAATGTYTADQRSIMNDEFQEMANEIDRIAESTDFNGIKGLNESGSNIQVHFGPGNDSAEDYYDVSKQNMQTGSGQQISAGGGGATVTVEDGTAFSVGEKVVLTDSGGSAETAFVDSISGNDVTVTAAHSGTAVTIEAAGPGSVATDDTDLDTFGSGDGAATEGWIDVNDASVFEEGDSVSMFSSTNDLSDGDILVSGVNTDQNRIYLENVNNGLAWEGENAADTYITVNDGGSGNSGLGIGSADISTADGAQSALTALDDAIQLKDEGRAHFGAMINRLKSTVAATSIQREKIQSAEAAISDVDVASEMAQLSRNRVLAQAGVSMLAQANSIPQMATSLLRG